MRTPRAQAVAAAEKAHGKLERRSVPIMSAEEAIQAAEEEGLILVRTNNSSGFYGVYLRRNIKEAKRYSSHVSKDGRQLHLGHFVCAEQAALVSARFYGAEHLRTIQERTLARSAKPLTSEAALAEVQSKL